MTSSPTVLPDARAREVLIEKLREVAALEDRNMKRHAHAIRTFATEAADYLATPPASDAAVPAREGEGEDERPLTAKEEAMIDAAWERHKAARPCTIPPEGWRCTRSSGHEGPCAAMPAAPKVASDTGAGFTWPEPKLVPVQDGQKLNPDRVKAAFELLNGELVIGEQFQLIEMMLDGTEYTVAELAIPTDTTDGATGGGEDIVERARASLFKLEVFAEGDDLHRVRDAIRAINYLATTPGGDLLEQAIQALRPFAGHVGKRGEAIRLEWGKDSWSGTLTPDHFYVASDVVRQFRALKPAGDTNQPG